MDSPPKKGGSAHALTQQKIQRFQAPTLGVLAFDLDVVVITNRGSSGDTNPQRVGSEKAKPGQQRIRGGKRVPANRAPLPPSKGKAWGSLVSAVGSPSGLRVIDAPGWGSLLVTRGGGLLTSMQAR